MAYMIWGRTYRGSRAMLARVAELVEVNKSLGASDDRVSEINALSAAIGQALKVESRPYVLLYRKAKANGEILKGRRTFKTDTEQARWIRNAPDSVAVTFYTL